MPAHKGPRPITRAREIIENAQRVQLDPVVPTTDSAVVPTTDSAVPIEGQTPYAAEATPEYFAISASDRAELLEILNAGVDATRTRPDSRRKKPAKKAAKKPAKRAPAGTRRIYD
jgi:hypothetical protein